MTGPQCSGSRRTAYDCPAANGIAPRIGLNLRDLDGLRITLSLFVYSRLPATTLFRIVGFHSSLLRCPVNNRKPRAPLKVTYLPRAGKE